MPRNTYATTLLGDLNGGLVAGLLSLPPAMALGALVFGALGDDYLAFGVVSGLASMAIANFAAGLLGSVRVMTVGPSTPAALMLAAALSLAMGAEAVTTSKDPAATAIVMVLFVVALAGVLEILLGIFNLGQLAKFIPFPVVAGQLNGLALLLLMAQLRPLFGLATAGSVFSPKTWATWQPLTFLVGAATIAAIVLCKRVSEKLPNALFGIVVGSALYHLLAALGFAAQLGPTIGAIPSGFPPPRYALALWELLAEPSFRPLLFDLVPSALGVAALLALGTLLSILVVDKHTGDRSNSSRELIAQGAANLLASFFGGNSVVGFSGIPIANYETGGRTSLSRLVVGVFGLLVLVVLGPLISRIPTVVFAGTLVTIGVSMADRWSLGLVPKLFSAKERTPTLLFDMAIVITVASILVGVSILHGVAVGVALSCVLFIVRMSRRTIRRQFDGVAIRANVGRNAEELAMLASSGERIQVLELEGALFFGAADRLGVELEKILETEREIVILDLKRVNDVDSTGAMALGQILKRAEARACRLVFSSVGPNHAFARLAAHTGILDAVEGERIFTSLDDALGWAEDQLLDRLLGADRYAKELPLERTDVLERFAAEDVDRLQSFCEKRSYGDGETVFCQGDDGDAIFLITAGRIELFRSDGDDERRIMTLCPGQVCGEMAIIDGGPRSATARAAERLCCYVLTRDQLEAMRKEVPGVAESFYHGLTRLLSTRLRVANRLSMELRG